MSTPWHSALEQVEVIRDFVKMTDDEFDQLVTHDQIVERSLKLTLDNGQTKIFKAFRAQHSNVLGPYKGGLRFHPEVSREEVMALAMWMSWKTAVVGLPLGGGKGGIQVDRKKLTHQELERLSRLYLRTFADVLGPDKDVPAPDVNTNQEIMAWMVDECRLIKGKDKKALELCQATFTGKPRESGGSEGRIEATGRGGYYILSQLAEKNHWQPYKTTIAVQGMGNVGWHFATLAQAAGFKIVAISDSQAAVVVPDFQTLLSPDHDPSQLTGLDLDLVVEHKQKHGHLNHLDQYQLISNEELLALPVDVLVPAALEEVINLENVTNIKAGAIIELANGPILAEADQILHDNGVVVVPDILANAGGVTVSYFEWLQNKAHKSWTTKQVNTKLEKVMTTAFDRVWNKWQRLNQSSKQASLRQAAYVLAIETVLEKLRAGRVNH